MHEISRLYNVRFVFITSSEFNSSASKFKNIPVFFYIKTLALFNQFVKSGILFGNVILKILMHLILFMRIALVETA